MALESDADLEGFFDTDEHAVSAVWSEGGTVNGIFDNPYLGLDLGGEVAGVEASQPVFRCLTKDVPNVSQGQTLTIGGVVYQIVIKRPDGTGVTDLVLAEA